jgi:hypothetical protein
MSSTEIGLQFLSYYLSLPVVLGYILCSKLKDDTFDVSVPDGKIKMFFHLAVSYG